MDDAEGRAVEVAELVGVVQALEHLGRDVRDEGLAQSLSPRDQPREQRLERLALEVLHGDEVPVRLADLVGVDDVGVVQAGCEAGLVEEHLDVRVVVRDPQALDDGELVEPHRSPGHREEDLGHAAAADPRERNVPAERLGKGAVAPLRRR